MEKSVEELILLSAGILALTRAGQSEPGDANVAGDDLLQLAADYLAKFETWVTAIDGANPLDPGSVYSEEAKQELRGRIEVLQTNHAQLVSELNLLKGEVVEHLGEIHRRGKALRTYIDRFPSRVSIAGKRKG